MKSDRDPSRSSARISPTAHYTGYTWLEHGLSHPAFATPAGRFLYRALTPANRAMAAANQPTLDGYLLARHRLIDTLLGQAITEGRIGQVIEVACGLSPRGYRFSREHGDRLTYVEADLPGMAAKKRELLERAGAGGPHHRVVDIDATADDGPMSLAAVAATLDPGRGVAIITEGLLNYFDPGAVTAMWRRFAAVLGQFPHGLYLADLSLGDGAGPLSRVFAGLLGVFVRGRIHFHFGDAEEATGGLRAAGFGAGRVHSPDDHVEAIGAVDAPSARVTRVIEARIDA